LGAHWLEINGLRRAILTGESKIAIFKTAAGTDASLHVDLDAAYDTIQRLRQAEVQLGMHIALAHDANWMCEGTDQVLMSLLSDSKRGEWLSRVKVGDAP